jgi:VanZ family protein
MRFALSIVERSWLAITLGLVAAIIVLSLGPVPPTPLDEVREGDKLKHLAAYGALAFPAVLARARGLGLWLAGFAALGGAIELIQPAVGRTAAWGDVLANLAGLTLGTLAGLALRGLVPATARRP